MSVAASCLQSVQCECEQITKHDQTIVKSGSIETEMEREMVTSRIEEGRA